MCLTNQFMMDKTLRECYNISDDCQFVLYSMSDFALHMNSVPSQTKVHTEMTISLNDRLDATTPSGWKTN